MGSMIYLSVGNFEIDWGKNHGFTDHNALYQPTDLSQVPYYYVDPDNPDKAGSNGEEFNLITEMKEGMSKPLKQVVERLQLLGYSDEYAQLSFIQLLEYCDINPEKFNFTHLQDALANLDVNKISADYGEGESFGKFFRRYIFDKLDLAKFVDDPSYVRYNVGEAMENFSAYSILHLLAKNPYCQELPVNWQFSDVAEGGYASRDFFIRPLDASKKFLIVTEGSSDSNIIKHAFELLKPHLVDFFTFVDMKEGYPFSGTGNLHNFTKGLISISVQNDTIILYDNDAEGVASYNKTNALKIPENMCVLKLPDLPALNSFKTIGPDGETYSNINGTGAAIECYLDNGDNAIIRWNNYNKDQGVYQGELIDKRDHMMRFFEVKNLSGTYDLSKIEAVLNMIIHYCEQMRKARILRELEEDSFDM